MYRLSANSRATISSTAIFLSQQSRQYFSSPRGSDTSLAPHSAHRDLATDFRGIGSIYHLQLGIRNQELGTAPGFTLVVIPNSQFRILNSELPLSPMDRPAHAGLRHLALNARDLEGMARFYVDL